jgi:phosphoribulokinase
VPHPDIHGILTSATREAAHIKLICDQDGKPVDALHVHANAPEAASRLVEEKLWEKIGLHGEIPESLGRISSTERSAPLAVVQLILLHYVSHT